MLTGRTRIMLFWVTIAMMIIVAVLAAMTILRACGSPTPEESPPTIRPAEISLCPGEEDQFTTVEVIDVTWEATGGRITEGGCSSLATGQASTVSLPEEGIRVERPALSSTSSRARRPRRQNPARPRFQSPPAPRRPLPHPATPKAT